MGVVYVKELWEGRSGSDGIERRREYTRMFEVRTDDNADDATVAGGTVLLPRNGSAYPTDAFALVVRIRPDQDSGDPTLWKVACDYSTEMPVAQGRESQGINAATGASEATASGGDPATRQNSPLNRPPVYKVSHEQTTEIVEADKDGNAILNSAGDPYDPPLEDEVSYAVVTVTKNLAVVQFDWLEQFVDSVNSVIWNGRAVRTCRMMAIEYEAATENGVTFWRVTFRVKIRPKKWDRKVIDRGFRETVTGSANKALQDPKTGAFSAEPILLDGLGKRLGPGLPPVYFPANGFRIKQEKAFSLLGI